MSSFPPLPIAVSTENHLERIDLYLIQRGVPLTRSRIQKLISEGQICLNGMPTRASCKVKKGDRIDIKVPPPAPLDLIPEAIPLDILYEDEDLLVLNKEAGMVVHPAPGHDEGTVVHALLHHCRDLAGIGGRERPGIIHRLDKETSGVMVIAKKDAAHQALSKQFKNHTIDKKYLAFVCGKVKKGGKINLAIGRDRINRKKISSRTAHPREAETEYRIEERFRTATLINVFPKTGRTHQIRVHMAHIHHPVAGDKIYGGKVTREFTVAPGRHMLHASQLCFTHPSTKERLLFSAPMPCDMADFSKMLQIEKRTLLSL
ncbi:MAG: RluA family pseudouridine synthase [Nitrospiria bacterium]